jgi:hypothetical protein
MAAPLWLADGDAEVALTTTEDGLKEYQIDATGP